MKIGLLFGSFNPVHTGHLLIASYFLEPDGQSGIKGMEKIWFVVSPQNPFKENSELIDENTRFKMVQLAIENNSRFEACDAEFKLSRPSFTIHTLEFLREKYPEHTFFPLIGGDNLMSFHLWKNYEKILENYEVLVYRRSGFDGNPAVAAHPHIKICDVPLLNISSTYIRELIRSGKSIRYIVPKSVEEFIMVNKLYL
ncbi:MAG: nicotinate (nicotinamide) nucleotide adenylyltransferase [Bacteroidia bacterium]